MRWNVAFALAAIAAALTLTSLASARIASVQRSADDGRFDNCQATAYDPNVMNGILGGAIDTFCNWQMTWVRLQGCLQYMDTFMKTWENQECYDRTTSYTQSDHHWFTAPCPIYGIEFHTTAYTEWSVYPITSTSDVSNTVRIYC
jgi:hypothetical protein